MQLTMKPSSVKSKTVVIIEDQTAIREMLVEILQPPHAQAIIDDLERKDVQQAELIQQHPELLTHMKGGKK